MEGKPKITLQNHFIPIKTITSKQIRNVPPSKQNKLGVFSLFWGEAAGSRMKTPIFAFLQSKPLVYICK